MNVGMTKLRKNMWIIVVVFSLFGDVFTTWATIDNPMIYESNPLWQDIYNANGYAELFIFKGMIVFVAYILDSILVEAFEDWAIPVIPMYLIYSGTTATINNLGIISAYDEGSIGISFLIALATFLFVEFLRERYGYRVT